MRGKRKDDKKLRNFALFGGFVITLILMTFYGSSLFTAFGPSSAWEADTELKSITMNGITFDDADELLDMGASLIGGRRITHDFDGGVVENWDGLEQTYTLGANPITYPLYHDTDAGMDPKVSFSVGGFFFTDKDGNRLDEIARDYILDESGQSGDVHYYFGFSVMFTTRGLLRPQQSVISITDEDALWKVDYIPEIGEVAMESLINVRIDSQSDFIYVGEIRDVSLLDTRTRYTIQAEDAGVSSVELNYFNQNYEWEEFYVFGDARPMNINNPITIEYNKIDSSVNNDATISAGVILKPGVDGWGDDYLEGFVEGDATNDVSGTMIYNVELLYDIVVDLSINGVPMSDYTARWAEGTPDGAFPQDAPPEYMSDWMIWLIIIIVLVVCVGCGGSKAKGTEIKLMRDLR